MNSGGERELPIFGGGKSKDEDGEEGAHMPCFFRLLFILFLFRKHWSGCLPGGPGARAAARAPRSRSSGRSAVLGGRPDAGRGGPRLAGTDFARPALAVEYASPFFGLEKGSVLQEARVFNDPQLDARRCQQVLPNRRASPRCALPQLQLARAARAASIAPVPAGCGPVIIIFVLLHIHAWEKMRCRLEAVLRVADSQHLFRLASFSLHLRGRPWLRRAPRHARRSSPRSCTS